MQQTGPIWTEGIPHFGAPLLWRKTKKKSLKNSDFLTEKQAELEAVAKAYLKSGT